MRHTKQKDDLPKRNLNAHVDVEDRKQKDAKYSPGALKIMEALKEYGMFKDEHYVCDKKYDNGEYKLHLEWDFRITKFGDDTKTLLMIEFDENYSREATLADGASEMDINWLLTGRKKDHCEAHRIPLLHIPYHDIKQTNELVSDFIEEHYY